ncbi:histidine kinase [Bradyrhizobium sacchari]|uniref:Diguanylate cyclase (GGDEF)-like protein n=1 Tax=Bradyrhizobium sacchari TaxID=1399419 RepID=A0A560JTK7_9BRAD|nr:EAL domain-containing protein [Bradyrhizobium sacchari]OPY94961.1 histidine kinase [Bradyrhizobium sacchari]TWB59864.1 diguanylate cyclase (GGDEF)-like protein [Bradyrhizobium sacchari]TWB74327.1 diguanylate cyclase (GGDEF)-like protein [Bradyrhizobium sacchari]
MGGRDRNGQDRKRVTGWWRAAPLLGLYRPALVAIAVGLLFSIVGAAAVARWENRVNRIEFENAAETEAIVMQNGMGEYISRLVALRTLFESTNDEVTRSEFETFSVRLFERHPGMLRIAWLPRVTRKGRAEYEAAAAADGVSGYRIKSLQGDVFEVAPQSDEYFPVFYSTQPKTSSVYGMNYASIPERLAALERARDNDGVAAIRTRLYEPREGGRLPDVLVAIPVYAKGTSRETVAERRRNLAGFVVGIFDLPLLIQSIRVTTGASPAVSVNVYPPFTGQIVSLEDMVPDYSSAATAPQSMRDVARSLHWSGSLKIGDTDWQVRAMPKAGGALVAGYDRAVAVLTVGMLLTLSLSTYLMLASRNSRRLSLANRRVLELAQTDILTGLPNRAFFLARLDELNSQLNEASAAFSILMLDLDRFKNVNDSLGHGAGDVLLRQVAQRLKSALRATDVLARLGGDEFAIIQEACEEQRASSTELAGRIAKLVAQPFLLPGHRVEIGTSIGIAIAPDHGTDQEQLLKKADLALYRSKSAGRNCFTVYDEAMSAELEARNTLEGDLRDAIARCQLEVHYQPFVDATSGARRGFEALVRWRHPSRGLIPPDQFIPLAEETGLIVPLGEYVLRRACADAAGWPSDLMVAVNLSPIQFKEAELFEMICAALADSGLSPERLEIEITESVLLERGVENHAFMERLKGIGVELALDDFGTGYSSLSYLTAFPFDKIKIDKSFIRNLTHQPRSSAIISSIVTLARGLDMSVTAEGVETSEEFERLRALGVNFAQGYLFGRPQPVDEIDLDATESSQLDAA